MYTTTIHSSSKTDNAIWRPDLGHRAKRKTTSKKLPSAPRETTKPMSTENHRGLQKDTTRRTRTRSSSTATRRIYRGNRHAESIYSTRPPSGEGDTPDTQMYTRSKGHLKGDCTQAYKPRDPTPAGCREGTGNTGANITPSGEPAPRR